MQKQCLQKRKEEVIFIMKKKNQKSKKTLRTACMHRAYANAIRTIIVGAATSIVISAPVVSTVLDIEAYYTDHDPDTEVCYLMPANSENQESIVDTQNMTQPPTTTATVVTIPPTTTTVTTTTTTTKPTTTTTKETTTTVTTTVEKMVEDPAEETDDEYYEEEENDSYEEYESSDQSYEEPVISSYGGTFEATYYACDWGACGYVDGEGYVQLTPGYSIASSYFPKGSMVYVEGAGLDGYYRVEDYCPSGGNIIDFFYTYDTVPDHFAYYGRYNINAYLVE